MYLLLDAWIRDFCTWVVFLSHGSLDERLVNTRVSWGKVQNRVLFWGPRWTEGVGSLGSMCSLELLNPAGSTQGLERVRGSTCWEFGAMATNTPPFPGQNLEEKKQLFTAEERKQIFFSFSLIHSENEQWHSQNKMSAIDHHTWKIPSHTKGLMGDQKGNTYGNKSYVYHVAFDTKTFGLEHRESWRLTSKWSANSETQWR